MQHFKKENANYFSFTLPKQLGTQRALVLACHTKVLINQYNISFVLEEHINKIFSSNICVLKLVLV